jgi:hypothetical protein
MKLQQYLIEQKGKPITFIRFGGLSAVNHKKFYKGDSYHSPPVKKGIYAFVWPYINDFLWVWKIPFKEDETEADWIKRKNDYIKKNRKKFIYRGMVWTHFTDVARGGRRSGSWVEIHTDDLMTLFRKTKHKDIKQLMSYGATEVIKDPYKRGLGGHMSTDHLEVFIEKVN